MIQANRRDYRTAFKKHLHAYSNWGDTGSLTSKRLILVYCVECGLKYSIMDSERIYSVSEAQIDIQNDLHSHNIYKLLKRLNQSGNYVFHRIETIHGDNVDPNTFHQICRYCVPLIDDHEKYLKEYDEQLGRIVLWLKERVY